MSAMTRNPASGASRTIQADVVILGVPCSSSTSIGRRRRKSATIRPSPTATSHAATTITISAKIWPSPLPCMRANVTSARLEPLSISSRQSRITSGLRRTSTPPAPIEKISAETTRYHSMLIVPAAPRPRSSCRAARRCSCPRRCAGGRATDSSRGSSSPLRRRARITAPTAATSSSIEAASNAIRKCVRNSRPISAAVPKPVSAASPVAPWMPAPSVPSASSPEPSTAMHSSANSAPANSSETTRSAPRPPLPPPSGSSWPPT